MIARVAKALALVVPYIGTWIETHQDQLLDIWDKGRTLYRYVD